jgi:serine-type D-Ala-D-Ala carboxypeptidase (penicillin-binding protein 5/6)
MTARLVLERAKQRDVFAAPAYNAGVGETVIGLHEGERMTVHDLLRALLLRSANDAAWDLATGVGGSVPAFVRMMNREAHRLHLADTHYGNPIGLDDPRNRSSASDLAKLASIDMRNRAFADIVKLTRATLRSGSRARLVTNRNDLVGRYRFVDGVKTGHTQEAGYVLVGAAHRRGASVISVVLGEPSVARRDADSLTLLRWGLAQYHRVAVLHGGQTITSVPIRWHSGRARLAPARSLSLAVRRGTPVRVRLSKPKQVKGPLPARRAVGHAHVLVAGRVAASVPLLTAERVPGASFLRRLSTPLRDALITLGVLIAVVACTLGALHARMVRRQRARSAQ